MYVPRVASLPLTSQPRGQHEGEVRRRQEVSGKEEVRRGFGGGDGKSDEERDDGKSDEERDGRHAPRRARRRGCLHTSSYSVLHASS